MVFTPLGLLNNTLVVNATKDDSIDQKVGDRGKATGVGLATWAILAYTEGWQYVWGGSSYGAVDCSGLMLAYRGVTGWRTDCWGAAKNAGIANGSLPNTHSESDYSGIPRIHGLGLHAPGHVGVYLGSFVTATKAKNTIGQDQGLEKTGMEIDARDSDTGCHMKLDKMGVHSWDGWYKVVGVEYPEKGFVQFNGKTYYYEPTQGKNYSEYVVNCSRTINGKKYTFDADGVCKQTVTEFVHTSKVIKSSKHSGGSGSTGGGTSTDSGDSDNSTDTDDDSGGTVAIVEDDEPSREAIEANRELTHQEKIRVEEINADLHNKTERDIWSTLYTIIGLFGILILIYSMFILIAYYIDIFNSFTNFSILQFISFGRMYPIGSVHNIDVLGEPPKNVKYINNVTIWFSFVIGVLASAILMNMHVIALAFISLSQWFNNNIYNN